MNCDFSDLKQETINCKGVNLGNLSVFFLLYLTGYWATDGLSIVGSPLEASDKSCLNNNWKCV